ncbi:MAG: V-type ATPase 116kDa subunit family protein [Promethearchaeota archaeon]
MVKLSNNMCLFKVSLDRRYKDIFLATLAEIKGAHIKSKQEYQSTQITEAEEVYKEKLKSLSLNLNILFKKLDITENDFQFLKVKEKEKKKYTAKNSHELIDYLIEEINFYTNRYNELDKYISDTKIELEKIKIIDKTYDFLEKYNLTRENLTKLTYFNFKTYTTFSKNIGTLKSIFDFYEFPSIIQVQNISTDRTAFFIIYPKDQETKLREKISLIHGEEVPILKKFLSSNGINHDRINNEIALLENYLEKYEKEIKRIKSDNILKFAAIYESISNLEEFNWAASQFEELSLDRLSYRFFILQSQKKNAYQKLISEFGTDITIEVINIGKKGILTKDKKLERDHIYKIDNKVIDLDNKLQDSSDEKVEKWDSLKRETPTKMTHNWLFRPFETLTKMYGTPSYSEIDPTPFLFFTFPLFFGIMFGDMGHGLVLIISGLIGAIIFRKRGGGIYNFSWIIFWCGWWAVLGGLFYGEFFGTEEFFGHPLNPIPIPIPFVGSIILYNPLGNVVTVLFFTIFVGVIQINLGWILQFINYWKQSRKFLSITESLTKIFFLDAIVYLVMRYRFDFNAWLAPPFPPILLPLIPGILLILFKPIGKILRISYLRASTYGQLIGDGTMDTFETVLSIPSNVLSYIRLMALALAHVSLMLAITAMVSVIPGEGIFVQIIVVISLIFGNIVVILIEGVLVFLNALRLHFYEFFFKFYEGRGTEFIPFILEGKFSSINFEFEARKDIITSEIEKEIETEETRMNLENARNYISKNFL